jgi:hypothetical protein
LIIKAAILAHNNIDLKGAKTKPKIRKKKNTESYIVLLY